MFDEQYPEDDEHAECRHEIHNLQSELERVKAERDEAKEKLIWTTNQLNILQKELWEIHGWDKESCRATNTQEGHIADMEHVKAELYEERSNHRLIIDQRREMEDALYSLKSRLPVNRDGDVVLWGDEVWATDSTGEPFSIRVEEIEFDKGEFWVNAGWRMIKLTDCHSTAESCSAANEKGENNGSK